MNKKYVPLHVHSHYSLLDGLSQPDRIAERIIELELDTCAISDHGTIAGSVQFIKEMKKKELKPLLGCELYISSQSAELKEMSNRKLSHLPVIAKNDEGWIQLVKATSHSNNLDNYYFKPRLSLEQLKKYLNGSIMGFSGHLGSDIANSILLNGDKPQPNWKKDTVKLAERMSDMFGKENFYLEVQLMDTNVNITQKYLVDAVREISKTTGIPIIATPDAHYAAKEDAEDQRVLLCKNMKVTMVQAKLPTFPLSSFFKNNRYHIPSYQEMIEYGHTEEELENTIKFASNVEKYTNVLRAPILAPFPCLDGYSPDTWLRELCRIGWRELIQNRISKEQHQEYANRVKYELEVLQGAGLSSYFLIVQDIIKFIENQGWIPGPGRGSAAGSLVSYLIGITQIDPMPYNLLFERFYNAGRNTKDRVSMPDIDIDVPTTQRDKIIEYMKGRYGHDRVCQMLTFGTMKGRKALKDVFTVHGSMSFDEMNRITQGVPEPAKVADELQEMEEEEEGSSSIIKLALQHNPEKFAEWCEIGEDGELTGPKAKEFAQAIRLEGTKTSQGKHPAGIIISPQPLVDICPMVFDTKTKTTIAGMEMNDLEDIGMIKFDILGVNLIDKVMGVRDILKTGDIEV